MTTLSMARALINIYIRCATYCASDIMVEVAAVIRIQPEFYAVNCRYSAMTNLTAYHGVGDIEISLER